MLHHSDGPKPKELLNSAFAQRRGRKSLSFHDSTHVRAVYLHEPYHDLSVSPYMSDLSMMLISVCGSSCCAVYSASGHTVGTRTSGA